MKKTYSSYIYDTIKGTDLHLHLYKSNHNRQEETIIYIHGGGFVYGSAHDLPDAYILQITQAGYDLILLEYPLAPEVKLGQILNSLESGVDWFITHALSKLDLKSTDYILFGRSAGAYLSALLSHRLQVKPKALWLFYGYYSLQEAAFRVPSRHYLQYPKIEDAVAKQLMQPKVLVEGPKETRFSLYIYYRQSGKWIFDILEDSENPADYSLTKEQLTKLPPAFLAASIGDADVPYRISKRMANTIPGAHLETIDSNEHDFDRTTTDSIGKDIYFKALEWLHTL